MYLVIVRDERTGCQEVGRVDRLTVREIAGLVQEIRETFRHEAALASVLADQCRSLRRQTVGN